LAFQSPTKQPQAPAVSGFTDIVIKNQLGGTNDFSSLSNDQSKVADVKAAQQIIKANINDKQNILGDNSAPALEKMAEANQLIIKKRLF